METLEPPESTSGGAGAPAGGAGAEPSTELPRPPEERATANPWHSRSFEWLTSSPPETHNFAATPHIARGPYDYTLDEAQARALTSPR